MVLHSCSESPTDNEGPHISEVAEKTGGGVRDEALDLSTFDRASFSEFLFGNGHALDCDPGASFLSFEKKSALEDSEFISGRSSPVKCDLDALRDRPESGFGSGDPESLLDRFSFREGIRKLCHHPVFQLSKSTRKPSEVAIVCAGEEG